MTPDEGGDCGKSVATGLLGCLTLLAIQFLMSISLLFYFYIL